MMNNMLYGINDKLPTKRLIVAALQQVIACFVATILIPQICGIPIAPAMVGAGLGTLIYQLFTRGQSPMFISSSGASERLQLELLQILPQLLSAV